MVEELTQYLYHKSMMKYIEVYVQKVNPFRTPQVRPHLYPVAHTYIHMYTCMHLDRFFMRL